jgi:hypothetical protein
MKSRNVVLAALAVVVLAAIGAAYWLYSSRDALLKSAIERYGPQLTGVPVTVKAVRLEPAAGSGAISGLAVGNPPGFKAPNALTLGEMRLTIDFSTLTKDVVHVKELVLEAPAVTYERGDGGDNLAVIQKHIDAEVAKLAGPKQAGPGAARKFVIEDLYVRNARASYGEAVTLPLPDLHLREVGKKTNGATAGEIAKSVWDAIARSAAGLASRALEGVKDGAKAVTNSVRGLFK